MKKYHVDKYIFFICLAALGVAGQNLANGKDVIFSHGDTEVTIKDEE
jgi:hypothetical protein